MQQLQQGSVRTLQETQGGTRRVQLPSQVFLGWRSTLHNTGPVQRRNTGGLPHIIKTPDYAYAPKTTP